MHLELNDHFLKISGYCSIGDNIKIDLKSESSLVQFNEFLLGILCFKS